MSPPPRANPRPPDPDSRPPSPGRPSGAIRILAVDDDPDIRRLITAQFGPPDYVVDTAADGHEGLDRANRLTPHLVITDVNMPGMDGWTFVRALRTRPETVLTPILFLTAQSSVDDRIRGFQLGADDYLPKPFSLEELDLRVKSVLKRAGRVRAEAVEPAAAAGGIRGTLDQIGLSAVLVLLEMERARGVLLVEREGESASLYFLEGRIVQAVPHGAPERRGAECVYDLLTWSRGRFAFTAQDVRMADDLGLPTAHLLMEAARRNDETGRPA